MPPEAAAPGTGAPRRDHDDEDHAPRGSRRWRHLVWALICAGLLVLIVQWALIRPYRIPSNSMAPTLVQGQRILVDRLGEHFGDPSRGDIVVFHPPRSAESRDPARLCARVHPAGTACGQGAGGRSGVAYVKRVLGLPGDRIALAGGHVVRDGRPVREPYAIPCATTGCEIAEFTVPPGTLFVLGDNRDDSNDSRFWGPVPRDWVIGRAVARYWPPEEIGGL